MIKIPYLKAGLLIMMLINLDKVQANANISFTEAWINEAPPGVTVLAAYMTIINESNHAINIESIESPEFERIEIHQTSYEDDLAKMQKLEQITIPANNSLVMQPGGTHIMLFNPHTPMKTSDQAILIINFSDGSVKRVNLTVKKLNTHSHNHSQHHH